jgi:flagellar M-ring protein FliF
VNGIRNVIQNTTPRGRIVMAASALGVVVLAFFLMKIASAPAYEQVVSGAEPAETPKITEALDKAGVKYEVRNNGTAIAVEKAKVGDAKVALAGAGLPGHSQPGFELMEKQKLGASDFQQKVTYQRALEGEIARTVEGVEGVQSAQVNLVLADDQLFQDEQQPARASVLLTTDGEGIEPGSVRGVASLVTSSVKGLKSENVSITDQTGSLLWPKAGAGDDGTVMTKQQAEQRYATAQEAKLNALLIQTLGPDKGRVQVSADVNADQTTRDKLSYDKKGTPVETTTEKEELQGSGGGGGGAAGTAGNIPQYANGGGGAGGDSNYNHETTSSKQAIGKTVERTKVAPGQVNRQNVAVVVDKNVPPADVRTLQDAMATAAGIDQARGDTITVSQVAFAKPKAPAKPSPAAGAMGALKWIPLALAMLLFLFFITRHLRRNETEQLEPVWLREIETPTTLADLEGERGPAFIEPPANPVREQVEEIVEQHPERVAQQVRAWLNSGA